MPTYMNPNDGSTFQAPTGGEYRRAARPSAGGYVPLFNNVRSGTTEQSKPPYKPGFDFAANPAAAPTPSWVANHPATQKPTPRPAPQQTSGMANHPVNAWAREQAAAPFAPSRAAPRAPAKMPSTINLTQSDMASAGLGPANAGPQRAAAAVTRGLGGLPGGLPATARAPFTPAPAPQHGMAASGPPRPAARVPTAPSGIAIEDPFSSKPAVAQRQAPVRPAPAVAQNPAAGGRRGRMQENRE